MNFEFLKILMGDGRDVFIRPVLLKFGVAFVVSVGGIVYTLYRTNVIYRPASKPSQPSPGHVESGELRNDDRVSQDSSFRKVPSNHHFISDRSSSGQHSGENNELVKECNMPVPMPIFYYKKNGESLVPEVEYPKDDEHDREIKSLLSRVKTLEEREKNLEIQMLEYYGVKEHENVLMELKNQLKLNNIEGKLYNLKMESLLSSNKRLESQLIDFSNVVTELEASRAKIKGLRKKLKSEAEHNREQILALQDRVVKMKDEEKKAAEVSQELQIVVMEREGLKDELEEMKDANRDLKLEIAVLKQKLDYVKMLATNALENEEVLELRDERRRLGKQYESLTEEIEHLKVNRSKDIEELAHLRWTNSCLRQELSNYQSGPGRTPPSKTLSPTSEEKSQHHTIPSNSNKESPAESMSDLGSGYYSSSQISCLTDTGEHDDLAFFPKLSPKKPENSNKPKVFAKLKKLLRGKGTSQGQNSQKPPLERAVSVDDITSNLSSDFIFDRSMNLSGGSSTSRRSFDIPRSYSRGRKSAAWENSNCSSRMVKSVTEDGQEWPLGEQPEREVDHNEAKSELLKYAEALKKCHSKKFQKRSTTQFLDLLEDTV